MSKPTPPSPPWAKGRHEDFDAVVVEITVCRDAHGRVFSTHALQADADEEVALSWPTGGQEQVGFALLVEAARREAMLLWLLRLSSNPDLLQKEGAELDREITDMSRRMVENMSATLRSIAADTLHDALGTFTLPQQ